MLTKIITSLIAGLLISVTTFGQEIQPQVQPSPVSSIAGQLEPKQEGVIRIGITTVKTKLRQDAMGQDMAEVTRTRWFSFLAGPTIELIPLNARIPIQINIEARQKDCDLILYSTVSQKTKGSLFGSLVRVVVPILTSAVPAGVGGTTANSIGQSIRNSVQDGAKDAAKNMANQAAANIKANDHVILEFALVTVGPTASPLLSRSLKTKASVDGEDIFSGLIEEAAAAILETAMKKN
ncbi:MAG: hypothetical protein WBO10_17005 [Pyrinomonadaceae bacterium]